jgi:hypothetical protein
MPDWGWYWCVYRFYHRNLTPRTVWSRLKWGVWNLIVWFPVIWRDRQWDDHFLYAVMLKKLQRMEKLQRKYGMSVDSHLYAKQMRICIFLLKRMMKDDYYRIPASQRKAMDERTDYISYLNRDMPRREHQDILDAVELEGHLEKMDRELLFKTLRKHVRKWWD